jgi:hypothetical protein
VTLVEKSAVDEVILVHATIAIARAAKAGGGMSRVENSRQKVAEAAQAVSCESASFPEH